MLLVSVFFLLIPHAFSLNFRFDSFQQSDVNVNISVESAASIQQPLLYLVQSQRDQAQNYSQGRATYIQAMHLWDKTTRKLANFNTNFTFEINSQGQSSFGDGMAFFLAPNGSKLPHSPKIEGGSIGLILGGNETLFNSRDNPFVAVEFDIYTDYWDPPGTHVGVDISSIRSDATTPWFSNVPAGRINEAFISYNASTYNLSISFTNGSDASNNVVWQHLHHIVDLRNYLPPFVSVGFSAATGDAFAIHQIQTWSFYSEELPNIVAPSPIPIPSQKTGRRILNKGRRSLPRKFKIAQGLASALLYLHEEWEQCVVHRDIKSSNIMLDSSFNAKLGDFGLARLVDHEKGAQTTALAGTMGYMAPECVTTGRASKETDVYSFGVVALEIICGRKPIISEAPEDKINIVQWVWDLYGIGRILEAVDSRLEGDFDHGQVECLLIVGLWCAHPDQNRRPSIRQAIHVLNFETPFPNLPSSYPILSYLEFPASFSILPSSNASDGQKLGQGGFGGVYKGFLKDSNSYVAIKRISKDSKQGKKEFASEVRIISQLRHRNLVQLIGWCHERKELLLVYEYMPHGSLDSHLFNKEQSLLTWSIRFKIAQGLASALLYLHEEWEQCVVHRDIKSSNIMLDSSFNAKLGDFGLARLVDHEKGAQTTALAGTMGYMAPECVTTGRASKETDVYSFGVVALEIICGRKPIISEAPEDKINIVQWVWDLYGIGRILEAVDSRLEGDFDHGQVECLLIVGLWCAHPDQNRRPSIRQAIHVLNFETPFPNLPSSYPILSYLEFPASFSILPSSNASGVSQNQNISFSSNTNTSGFTTTSDDNVSPSVSLLYSRNN
ncbi:hypothetical protein K1719_046122 [Acacia pycnantha]|nr:hypothetical protein K1719_046122 [Acacia pycnantha]